MNVRQLHRSDGVEPGPEDCDHGERYRNAFGACGDTEMGGM
jgi:hypothetical protein